jgi:hypothetical protein
LTIPYAQALRSLNRRLRRIEIAKAPLWIARCIKWTFCRNMPDVWSK